MQHRYLDQGKGGREGGREGGRGGGEVPSINLYGHVPFRFEPLYVNFETQSTASPRDHQDSVMTEDRTQGNLYTKHRC
jgi:hypothetical protein